MISNTNLILYACVAKGSTIVAELCRESELAETAQGCVEKTPPHHSAYSHTEKKRTYMFLIEHPFAYFAISHEDLDRSDGLRFLNQLKQAFQAKIGKGSGVNLTARCFQAQMDPFFREVGFSPASRNPSTELSREREVMVEKTSEGLKKKKKKGSGEMGELPAQMVKNAPILFPGSDRQRAKQVWKKHVWVVLMLDLLVCSILFGIWLWVCTGLQCIQS